MKVFQIALCICAVMLAVDATTVEAGSVTYDFIALYSPRPMIGAILEFSSAPSSTDGAWSTSNSSDILSFKIVNGFIAPVGPYDASVVAGVQSSCFREDPGFADAVRDQAGAHFLCVVTRVNCSGGSRAVDTGSEQYRAARGTGVWPSALICGARNRRSVQANGPPQRQVNRDRHRFRCGAERPRLPQFQLNR